MYLKPKKTLGYLSGNGGSISHFSEIFDNGVDLEKATDLKNIHAIILWGGTDIHPSWYNQKAHPENQVKYLNEPSLRDKVEWEAMVWAQAHNVPIIGICRGAQFLCAFAGGKLIQHSTGHSGGSHGVVVKNRDGSEETFITTTCHHQMMFPWETNHELLGWTPKSLSKTYDMENELDITHSLSEDLKQKVLLEPEVVYFPNVKGFAIQGHPEWMSDSAPFVKWCLNEINFRFFGEELEQAC